MSNSKHDALMTSNNGRRTIIQIRETQTVSEARALRRIAVSRRIQSLKELVHFTFVEYPKLNGHRVRFDIYQASKEQVIELGIKGGDEFEHALTALQFAYRSRQDFQDAVETVNCPHDFNEYESSDTVSRHS
jgi:hypothetical protein